MKVWIKEDQGPFTYQFRKVDVTDVEPSDLFYTEEEFSNHSPMSRINEEVADNYISQIKEGFENIRKNAKTVPAPIKLSEDDWTEREYLKKHGYVYKSGRIHKLETVKKASTTHGATLLRGIKEVIQAKLSSMAGGMTVSVNYTFSFDSPKLRAAINNLFGSVEQLVEAIVIREWNSAERKYEVRSLSQADKDKLIKRFKKAVESAQ